MHCHTHHTCAHTAMATAEALCAKRGLRFTEQRKAVFSIIWGNHKALTAAQIMEKLGNSQPPVTYRALEFLQENGLIHHVASINAYIGCTHVTESGHVGHLLVCESCHDVEELDHTAMSGLAKAAKTQGFQITDAHIELLGRCRNCA